MNGTLLRGSHASSSNVTSDLHFQVSFDQDVSQCAYVVTPTAFSTGTASVSAIAISQATNPAGSPNTVIVTLETPGGDNVVIYGFSLVVFC